MKLKSFIMTGVVLLISQALILPGMAQDRNVALDDTLQLRAGAFFPNLSASVKSFGVERDVDGDISVDDMEFGGSALWRITPRWRLSASYTGINESSKKSLRTGINVGSLSIPAGTSLKEEFESDEFKASIGYAFFRGDSSELGVDLGINYITIKDSYKVSSPGSSPEKISSLDVSEPLPTIGVFFNYAFTPDWYLTSRAGFFSFDIGDIDGTIFDAIGGIEYRPWERVGFGFAYTYTYADLTVSDDNVKTDVDYDYNGPFFYMVFGL